MSAEPKVDHVPLYNWQSLIEARVRAHIGIREYQGRERNVIEYYIEPVPKPLAVILLSSWVAWHDDNPCPSSGRNSWIFDAVLGGKRAKLPPEWTARLVRVALTRDPEPDEIERAVRTVYDSSVTVAGERVGIKTKPDPAKTEAVVAASSMRVQNLLAMACNRARDFTFPQIATRLWQPYALIGCGVTREAANLLRVEALAKHPRPEVFQFVVPNSMRKLSGKTQGGKKSARSIDNACCEEDRRWLVIECDYAKFNKDGVPTIWGPSIERWEAAGISVKDAAIRVVEHLLNRHAPRLALVVDSGGKSLHCWLNVLDASTEEKRAIMEDAVGLGADKSTFTLNQWVRFPGGTRRNGDGTAARQEILYFDPDACPKLQKETP